MDYSILANASTVALSQVINKGANVNVLSDSPIDIPGTIVGNLSNVVNTKSYMEQFSRYNNYLTCNLGMAQMAADRYMSLKERIPMSMEYYKTPTEKKEIVMYINPEKMNITTSKVIQKVYTRGGIYFHHYGDDVWTLKISGTVGYAQMHGIEALEEIYHNSGTLLKYQNVDVDTVHTNKITSYTNSTLSSDSDSTSISSLLSSLSGSNSSVSQYLGRVIGTATDALGYTDTKGDGSGSLVNKIFGATSTASQSSNKNLFQAVLNGAMNLNGVYNDVAQTATGSTGLISMMKAASQLTGNATNFKGMFNLIFKQLSRGMSTTAPSIISSIASDLTLGLFGGSPRTDNFSTVLSQLDNGTQNWFKSVLQMLTGDFTVAASTAFPMTATSGNYYTLGTMSATELNNVVGTVQSFNASQTINHEEAATNWSDIEDQLTDLYRPRQIIIYFDDRVYIGHFNSFSWNRVATTPLIYYDMQFTVTRQIKIAKQNLNSNGSYSGTSLGSLLGTVLAGATVDKIFKSI